VELGQRHLVLDEELQGPVEVLGSVVVQPEHDEGHDLDSPPPDLPDHLRVILGPRPALVELRQVRLLDGLEADGEQGAAGLGGQIQQIAVLGDLDGALAGPAELQGPHGPEKIPCVGPVGHRIVIQEENVPRSHGPDVADIPEDVAHGTLPVAVVVVLRHGTVFAGEGTSPGHQERKLEVVIPVDGLPHELPPEQGKALQIHPREILEIVEPVRVVDSLPKASRPEILHQVHPKAGRREGLQVDQRQSGGPVALDPGHGPVLMAVGRGDREDRVPAVHVFFPGSRRRSEKPTTQAQIRQVSSQGRKWLPARPSATNLRSARDSTRNPPAAARSSSSISAS